MMNTRLKQHCSFFFLDLLMSGHLLSSSLTMVGDRPIYIPPILQACRQLPSNYEIKEKCVVVTNIKLSAKVVTNLSLADIALRFIKDFNFKTTFYSSFIVAKCPATSLCYILFKKKQDWQNDAASGFPKNHCNISGLATEAAFIHALSLLSSVTLCPLHAMLYSIDNISSWSNACSIIISQQNNPLLNLSDFASFMRETKPFARVIYTPECFSACRVKFFGLTLMIYSSGKIFLCGAKEIESIVKAIECVTQAVMHVSMKPTPSKDI